MYVLTRKSLRINLKSFLANMLFSVLHRIANEIYLDSAIYQDTVIMSLLYDFHFKARNPGNRPILVDQQLVGTFAS